MNVSLTTELERFVQEKVRTGRYNSASEVIREALRVFHEREQLREIHIEELRKKIAAGIASLDRGDGIDGEQALGELQNLSAERRRLKAS
jgi:antitoxin ParD1/3/4